MDTIYCIPLTSEKKFRVIFGDEILSSYIGIIIDHHKDPYLPTSLMEGRRLFSWLILRRPPDEAAESIVLHSSERFSTRFFSAFCSQVLLIDNPLENWHDTEKAIMNEDVSPENWWFSTPKAYHFALKSRLFDTQNRKDLHFLFTTTFFRGDKMSSFMEDRIFLNRVIQAVTFLSPSWTNSTTIWGAILFDSPLWSREVLSWWRAGKLHQSWCWWRPDSTENRAKP